MSLHNPAWQYIPAAAHSDASKFRERQLERIKRAQQSKPNVPIPLRSANGRRR